MPELDEDEDMVEVRTLVADLPNSTIYRHFYGSKPEPGCGDVMSNFSYPRELEGDKERRALVDGTSHWCEDWGGDYYSIENLYIVVPHTTWGDYVGGSVEKANHRAILEEFAEYVIDVSGDYSSSALYLPLAAKIPQHFADGLLGLLDYPIWDEGCLSDVEQEIVDESWDEFQRDEFKGKVRDILCPDFADDAEPMIDAMGGDDFLSEFYFSTFLEKENLYPECETAVSAIFPDWERAAEECADAIIAAFLKPADQPEEQEALV
jgi:hypothetical protein